MGGRGAYLTEQRNWRQVARNEDLRVSLVSKKDSGASVGLPLESISPNRIYASLRPDGTLKQIMPDVKIFHGVGAKARTYDIYDTAGNLYHYAEGTWVKNVEVFAGYKVKTPLHEGVAEGLSEEYGGSPEKWQHVKGIGTIDDAGDYVQAEVHWFQEESVGQVRHRVKRWLE